MSTDMDLTRALRHKKFQRHNSILRVRAHAIPDWIFEFNYENIWSSRFLSSVKPTFDAFFTYVNCMLSGDLVCFFFLDQLGRRDQ